MTTAPAFRTDERPARGTRPRLPHPRAVLREQLRTTGHALRWPALVVAALVALATLRLASRILSRGAAVELHDEPTALLGLVGALMPIAVWARDERFGPGFLWTLPVDRRRHALIKVLAGWLWLMGGVALLALWMLVLAVASGGRVLPLETLQVLGGPAPVAGALDPAALRTVQWAPGPVIWAVPFTAATVSYLLASALALGTRHPLRWVVGTALALPLSSIAGEVAGEQLGMSWLANAPPRALELLIESRFGLDAVLTARTSSLDDAATLTTGQQVMVWSAVPDLADWRTATLLWTGLGLLALWAAASRHRERRRA
ncbi:hypothetical protein [Roseisolibacter agri]|uniref:ABC-2 family transporter protein n=1 Tax=Roseisolibacter agri TaxID=2014610 RepID=A0AA37Q5J1_9BACT|nr:hypothetical protein [Roseisolibacter agri]GLC26975.1 hypothetical protein rosag_34880 [Roseisolibacter agri]